MTSQELENLYNTIAGSIQNEAANKMNSIDANALAKGPSLGGRNAVGSYNYNRNVAPTTNTLSQQLVTTGKQLAFKQAINEALDAAATNYKQAQSEYSARQAAKATAAANASYNNSATTNQSSGASSTSTFNQQDIGSNTVTGVDVPSGNTGTSPYKPYYDTSGKLIGFDSPTNSMQRPSGMSDQEWFNTVKNYTGFDDAYTQALINGTPTIKTIYGEIGPSSN